MDYEKLRKKREAEANARLAQQREERQIKEQKDRDRIRKELERKRWDEMAMEKERLRKAANTAQSEEQARGAIKELEERKKSEQQRQEGTT